MMRDAKTPTLNIYGGVESLHLASKSLRQRLSDGAPLNAKNPIKRSLCDLASPHPNP